MSEEQITKIVLKYLIGNNWSIISYDFPQSGTGTVIQPINRESKTKNKGAIVPDIIAIREDKVAVFENKDHFDLDDFKKIKAIKNGNEYLESFQKILNG